MGEVVSASIVLGSDDPPFYCRPELARAHVALFYRNFAAAKVHNPASHVGLGVNAMFTARVLRKHGVRCDVVGIVTAEHIERALRERPHVTHAIIEAPFIPSGDQARLCHAFPDVHFVVRAHSQIGFLQVEAGAIKLLRELMTLSESALNLSVSANARSLATFFERTYHAHTVYLPNLYDLDRHTSGPRECPRPGRTLRIASFGAIRLLKNHTTSAAAALIAAEHLGRDLEFFVNWNREEGGRGVLDALRNMFEGVRGARLVEIPWEPWPNFRRTIGHMDLCIQLSFTETFNIVTADAAAEGVPSVVTSAIEWAPHDWRADGDNADDAARTAVHLLHSRHAAADGRRALERYVDESVRIWLGYLGRNPLHGAP